MSFTLRYAPAAIRDLRKLGTSIAGQVMADLDTFADTAIGDVKKRQGVDPPEWQRRSGAYRAGLAIDHHTRTIEVLYVRHRHEPYRR